MTGPRVRTSAPPAGRAQGQCQLLVDKFLRPAACGGRIPLTQGDRPGEPPCPPVPSRLHVSADGLGSDGFEAAICGRPRKTRQGGRGARVRRSRSAATPGTSRSAGGTSRPAAPMPERDLTGEPPRREGAKVPATEPKTLLLASRAVAPAKAGPWSHSLPRRPVRHSFSDGGSPMGEGGSAIR
jgi:hypothetical protein